MTDAENLAIYSHGKFLMQWQLIDRARTVAEGLVTVSPEFALGWFLLSELYDTEQRLAYAKRAFQINRKNMEIALYYCDLEIEIGDRISAKTVLEDIATREDFWGARAKLMLGRI